MKPLMLFWQIKCTRFKLEILIIASVESIGISNSEWDTVHSTHVDIVYIELLAYN